MVRVILIILAIVCGVVSNVAANDQEALIETYVNECIKAHVASAKAHMFQVPEPKKTILLNAMNSQEYKNTVLRPMYREFVEKFGYDSLTEIDRGERTFTSEEMEALALLGVRAAVKLTVFVYGESGLSS